MRVSVFLMVAQAYFLTARTYYSILNAYNTLLNGVVLSVHERIVYRTASYLSFSKQCFVLIVLLLFEWSLFRHCGPQPVVDAPSNL